MIARGVNEPVHVDQPALRVAPVVGQIALGGGQRIAQCGHALDVAFQHRQIVAIGQAVVVLPVAGAGRGLEHAEVAQHPGVGADAGTGDFQRFGEVRETRRPAVENEPAEHAPGDARQAVGLRGQAHAFDEHGDGGGRIGRHARSLCGRRRSINTERSERPS